MKKAFISYSPYLIAAVVLFSLLCNVQFSHAQDCQRNMLFIPDSASYAVIPNTTLIDLSKGCTIEWWMKATTFKGNAGIVEQSRNADTGAFSIRYGATSGLAVTLKLNTGIVTLTTASLPGIQTWNHFAVTFTPSDSIRIYFNGNVVLAQKTTATSLTQASDSIFIGHSMLTRQTFLGNIDELRLWSVVRTQSEIQTSRTTPFRGNEQNFSAYYRFDDRTGVKKLHDFTEQRSEGVIVGSAICIASTSPVVRDTGSGYMLAAKEKYIDFGVVLCKRTVDTIIHLYNRGFDTVGVSNRGFIFGSVFNIVADNGFPLPPDSTRIGIVSVQADFKVAGTFFDTLYIESGTECGGTVRVIFKIRFEDVGIAFTDSVVNFPQHVDCDTSRPTFETELKNIGTRKVTITKAQFTFPVGITVVSPIPPFEIESGKSVPVIIRQDAGVEGNYSTTLHVNIGECFRFADLIIKGKRTRSSFTIPSRIDFPFQYLKAGGVSLDTFFVLRNTGSEVLFATNLTVAGGGYKFAPNQRTSSYRDPGTFDTIRIHFDRTTCGTFLGSIRLQGKPCCLDTTIKLSVTIAGPELVSRISLLDMGATCSSKDTTITFINKSNMKVTLSAPVFSKLNIFSLVNPADLPVVTNPGDTLRIRVRFAPTTPGEKFLQAVFPLKPCGEVVIDLHGILGVGKFLLADTPAEFGQGCDLKPQQQQILLINQTGRAVNVNGVNTVGSANIKLLNPTIPFILAKDESRKLTLIYSPAALTSDETEFTLSENGCYITSFIARGTRERASVSWVTPSLVIDTICKGRTAEAIAEVINHGKAGLPIASYRIVGSKAFSIQDPTGRILAPDVKEPFTISFLPDSIGNFDGVLELVLAPCNDTTRIPLHGVGGPKPELFISTKNIDFGKLRVGKSDTICVTLANRSCAPLTIAKDAIVIALQKAFSIDNASITSLPSVISDSNSFSLCFVFHPQEAGIRRTNVVVTIGNSRDTITLTGEGASPDLAYIPTTRILEFGDVIVGKSAKLPLIIINGGNDSTNLTYAFKFHQNYDTLTPPILTPKLNAKEDTTYLIAFSPTSLGIVTDTFFVQWDLGIDKIILRGRGTSPGVLLSKSEVDFGDVRVNKDAYDTINVTASEGYPITITSEFFVGDDSTQFSVRSLQASQTLSSDKDTLRYELHFKPLAEQVYQSNFVLRDANQERGRILTRGRGIDAHIVILDTPLVDFNVRDVGTSFAINVRVYNSGFYTLQLDAATTNTSIFQSNFATNTFVLPGDTVTIPVTFSPLQGIAYTDVLTVSGDAPEKQKTTWLKGIGKFGSQGFPIVTYKVQDASVRVGDILDIPITIGGRDLALLADLDSFAVRLRYDPTVLFIHSVSAENALLQPFQLTMTREEHDSAVLVIARGPKITPHDGVLFTIKTEALLGPNDSTRIVISDAYPQNTAATFLSSGLYYVTDCGNYRTNITYKGPYSVSQSSPNPTSNSITLHYELGLDGYVTIDLYDGLGRLVRSLVRDSQKAGKHIIKAIVDDLPSGEYTYVVRSLEYRGEGRLLITK